MHLDPPTPDVQRTTPPARTSPAPATRKRPARWHVRLVVAAFCLAAALLVPRLLILRQAGDHKWAGTFQEPLKDIPKLIVSGTYDSAFCFALAVAFLIPLLTAHWARRRRTAAAVYGAFVVAATGVFLAGLGNVSVVAVLGRPANYAWLYYSDFLQSVDSQEAIKASLSAKNVVAGAMACLGFALIALATGRFVDRNTRRFVPATTRKIALVVMVATIAGVLGGQRYAKKHRWPYDRLANPVYTMASTWAVGHRNDAIFVMKTPVVDNDLAPPKRRAPSTMPAARPAIRHVVLWVFESVPWEYLGTYGSKYGATPHLDKWAAEAAVFENVYAHAPATNKTLFSLLCSTYPWISFKAETEQKPDIAIPSIASELKSRGFASGFFYSGDLSYQSAGDFVRYRGFDVVQDYKSRNSSRKLFTNEQWPFLNGSDDLSTAESLMSWLDQQRAAGKSTFSMLWTNMTHYPYVTDGQIKPLGPEEHLFNHYLNALHYGDRAFGALMDHLSANRLLDETLVVVVSDHGEAFMRHWQLSHAGKIYEENCHVPCLVINPRLFDGQRYKTVGGIVDVAPTITDVLGLPPAAPWQGRSLFSSDRPKRTYFFSPWSDMMFGFREADFKFIFNATTDQCEIYDLAADPTEQFNRIKDHEKNCQACKDILAAWVQHQDRLFEKLIPGR